MSTRAALILAAILLLLPVLYVGSYLALVSPSGLPAVPGSNRISPGKHYRINNTWAAVIFWPLEQIDRKVRPGAWETPWYAPDVRNGAGPFH